jgi:hypothetical protein
MNAVSVFDPRNLRWCGTGLPVLSVTKIGPLPHPRRGASQRLGRQSTNGFSTVCFLLCFFSRSLRASIASAFSVVSVSAARIRSDRQPSTFILISSPLKDPGSVVKPAVAVPPPRELFLPFVAHLKLHVDIVNLDARTDFLVHACGREC